VRDSNRTPNRGIDTFENVRDKILNFSEYLPANFVKREKAMKARAKMIGNLVLALSLVFATSHVAAALEVGDKAPDFDLDSSKGGKLKLSSLKGKNVLINFYVLDFSPT